MKMISGWNVLEQGKQIQSEKNRGLIDLTLYNQSSFPPPGKIVHVGFHAQRSVYSWADEIVDFYADKGLQFQYLLRTQFVLSCSCFIHLSPTNMKVYPHPPPTYLFVPFRQSKEFHSIAEGFGKTDSKKKGPWKMQVQTCLQGKPAHRMNKHRGNSVGQAKARSLRMISLWQVQTPTAHQSGHFGCMKEYQVHPGSKSQISPDYHPSNPHLQYRNVPGHPRNYRVVSPR